MAWSSIPSLFGGETTGPRPMPGSAAPAPQPALVPAINVPNARDAAQVDTVAKLPLVNFGGDIVIAAGADQNIDVFAMFAGKCTGLSITNVANPVQLNINGGGYFTIYGTIDLDDAQINSLRIKTGALTGCTLQLRGV